MDCALIVATLLGQGKLSARSVLTTKHNESQSAVRRTREEQLNISGVNVLIVGYDQPL